MTHPALPLVLRAAFILIGCVLLARGLGLALVRRSPSRMAARRCGRSAPRAA
ncbi:hypothetical protein HMPREF0731_4257, partial [Pseudoroseomonas cervicalis ATCC 49957]